MNARKKNLLGYTGQIVEISTKLVAWQCSLPGVLLVKVITIVGARPQFIKAATVSRAFRNTGRIDEAILHTGQHYDENMSDVFFQELGIPRPEFNLQVGSGTHGVQTGRMLEAIDGILSKAKPDWVLVYGDTNSTIAGALSAAKMHVPVAHVEAGLRSFNKHMPEEINRILTDQVASMLFAPTPTAVKHLAREGITGDKVNLVGDVMYDAALHFSRIAENDNYFITKVGVTRNEYILATIHRAENTDDPARLSAIFKALAHVSQEIPIVLPLHPRTRGSLDRLGLLTTMSRHFHIIQPLGYLDMTILTKGARLVVTDSGGLQKEAFFHRKPCVTLRYETEWTELIEMGWNRLLPPTSEEAIYQGLVSGLSAGPGSNPPEDLYGGGQAAARIAEILLEKGP